MIKTCVKTMIDLFSHRTVSCQNMVRTSEYVKLRILALFRLNFKVCQVVRELSRKGIKLARKTVGKFFKKFRDEDFALCDSPRCGRPKILQQRHLDFINTKMEENDELTAIGKSRYRFWNTFFKMPCLFLLLTEVD